MNEKNDKKKVEWKKNNIPTGQPASSEPSEHSEMPLHLAE